MKTQSVLFALVALFFCFHPEPSTGGGLTIITHGHALNGAASQDWINECADAIAARSGTPSSVPIYEITIAQNVRGVGDVLNEITSVSWLSGPTNVFSQSANAEVIFKVNWSDCATQMASGLAVPSSTIAEVLVDYFIDTTVNGHAWIEQPIHVIGHSRGGSVCSEISRMFGSHGIWVDQQTTLDPHPVNNDGFGWADWPFWFINPTFSDASVQTYNNTIFADNYWEDTFITAGFVATYPAGEQIDGALNVNLNAYFYEDTLQEALSADHSHVIDWYFGTISPIAQNLLTESAVALPRSIWYEGRNGGASTGYNYSRIAGGDRPATGLHAYFGGNTVGQPVSRLTAAGSQWPNVFNMQVLDSRYTAQNVPQFTVSESLTLQFQYQSYANLSQASLYLDMDRNPYNGNSSDILGAVVSCPANGAGINAKTAIWDTTGCSPGTYYLYVKIEDGFGHVRYVYAIKPVRLMSQPGSSSATLLATADAAVNELWPNSNYGSASYTTMDLSGTMGSRKRALVRFDLSSIPAGSTINSVELKLYATLCSNPDAINTCLMSLGGPWSEQWVSASDPGVCWNNEPPVEAGLCAWKTFTATGLHSWNADDYPDLLTLVQQWGNGTKANYGFLLEREQGHAGETWYRTRHTSVSSERPQLVVTYTPPLPAH